MCRCKMTARRMWRCKMCRCKMQRYHIVCFVETNPTPRRPRENAYQRILLYPLFTIPSILKLKMNAEIVEAPADGSSFGAEDSEVFRFGGGNWAGKHWLIWLGIGKFSDCDNKARCTLNFIWGSHPCWARKFVCAEPGPQAGLKRNLVYFICFKVAQ